MFKRQKWTIDGQRVDQARRMLGLAFPATIAIDGQKRDWWGIYDIYPLHSIRINHSVPKAKVSLVIWHELGHALQCERDYHSNGFAFEQATYAEYGDLINPWSPASNESLAEWKVRYYTLPMEEEAEEIALLYYERYPLIA